MSNPIGFLQNNFRTSQKIYSCFYKINLVNMQIFIHAEEKGKEETLIHHKRRDVKTQYGIIFK
jgi:hypothetical protein